VDTADSIELPERVSPARSCRSATGSRCSEGGRPRNCPGCPGGARFMECAAVVDVIGLWQSRGWRPDKCAVHIGEPRPGPGRLRPPHLLSGIGSDVRQKPLAVVVIDRGKPSQARSRGRRASRPAAASGGMRPASSHRQRQCQGAKKPEPSEHSGECLRTRPALSFSEQRTKAGPASSRRRLLLAR
jgi:hypothetical protein